MPVRTLRRRVLSVAAVAAVLFLSGRGSDDVAARPAVVDPSNAIAQRMYPEVRLRKMHLVRPDLIPFPIDFDVYC